MRERERERGEGEGERGRESELESELGERVRGYHSMFTSVTHVPKMYSVCVHVVCVCVCVCCHASLLISLDPDQARIEQK